MTANTCPIDVERKIDLLLSTYPAEQALSKAREIHLDVIGVDSLKNTEAVWSAVIKELESWKPEHYERYIKLMRSFPT